MTISEQFYGVPMLESITTEAKLLAKLKQAVGVSQSSDDLREQRLSFILGNLPKASEVTRSEVVKVLDQIEGTKAA